MVSTYPSSADPPQQQQQEQQLQHQGVRRDVSSPTREGQLNSSSGETNTAGGAIEPPLSSSSSRGVPPPTESSSSSVPTKRHLSSSLVYKMQLLAPTQQLQPTDDTANTANHCQSHQIKQEAEGCLPARSGRGHQQETARQQQQQRQHRQRHTPN